VPGRTITWSPALVALVAALLMVHNGASEVPGPVSLHSDGLVLSSPPHTGGQRHRRPHCGRGEDQGENAEDADQALT